MYSSFRLQAIAATLALALATPLVSAQVGSPIGMPAISGPIPVTTTPGVGLTRDYPQFSAEPYINLANAGYLEEEFFVQGSATRYQAPDMANGVAISNGHPYKTRLLVRKPADMSKFNGIVLVEWVNVTSGYGADLHWQYSSDYLTRNGYIHIGVQAQRVGVHQEPNGLKSWSPNRYGSLDLTDGGKVMDDSLSYDVFSQVGRALKGPQRAQFLGSAKPKAVLAVGQSQSALRLTSYYNSIQPLHRVYDGFMLQVAGGPFRTDLKEPVLRLLTETEVLWPGQVGKRQPDTNTVRSWELAGASHVDYFWLMNRQALAIRDGITPPSLKCTPEPASHVPLKYVLNAAYHHLTQWVLNKVPAPTATPLLVSQTEPATVLPRDANGLAYGGIRQAAVDVPVATNRGDQPGITPGCSNLYGQHVPFSDAKLQQLYPTKEAYFNAVQAVTQKNVQDGFILPEDAEEILRMAKNSPVGTGRPVPLH